MDYNRINRTTRTFGALTLRTTGVEAEGVIFYPCNRPSHQSKPRYRERSGRCYFLALQPAVASIKTALPPPPPKMVHEVIARINNLDHHNLMDLIINDRNILPPSDVTILSPTMSLPRVRPMTTPTPMSLTIRPLPMTTTHLLKTETITIGTPISRSPFPAS